MNLKKTSIMREKSIQIILNLFSDIRIFIWINESTPCVLSVSNLGLILLASQFLGSNHTNRPINILSTFSGTENVYQES